MKQLQKRINFQSSGNTVTVFMYYQTVSTQVETDKKKVKH